MSGLSWALLFSASLLQLLIFGSFDLGVDESHYMLYARHLDLSYFDHPPLVGWVHFIFNSVLGENLFAARLPAILIGFYSSVQLMKFLRDQDFSEETALWSTLAMSFCFQFFALNLFLLPDTLCLFLIWPMMKATVRVCQNGKILDWLVLGLCLGLMGLSKYTAILFMIPIAVMILQQKRFSFLKEPGFYLAVVLAFIVVSPVFIWNAQRDWMSFRYQGTHVLGGESGIESFLKSWAMQFLAYSPFLWGFSFFGIWRLYQRKNLPAQFALWSGATYGIFFLISSWKSVVLPHWPIVFYLFALTWGFAEVFERGKKKVAKLALSLTAGFVFILAFLFVTGWGYGIPLALKEVTGWPVFMPEIAKRLKNENDGIAFLNWTYGGRALYYAPNVEKQIFIIDDRFDQYDLWNTASPAGRDLWIVQFSYDEKDLRSHMKCQDWGAQEKIPISARGFHQYDVLLQLCRGYQAL